MRAKYGFKDSGRREEYDTGAQRDSREGKGRYDLISPHFTKRLAAVAEKGAVKYGAWNYAKGISFSRVIDSALRHLHQYMLRANDEDHLAHAAANIMFLIHFEEEIAAGRLPSTLDDIAPFTQPGFAGQLYEEPGDEEYYSDEE